MQSDLRVMVLEDHGFQRRMALRLLQELGVPVEHLLEAADAPSALALLDGRATPPDLVLVDLDMPGMDGIQFLTHLAQRRLARNVALVSALDPAVLNTVHAMAASYGLNIAGVVEKPLSLDKLGELLRAPRLFWPEAEAPCDDPLDLDALSVALQQGAIQPWFQLQVDLGNGKPRAVEALARWIDRGVVRPPSCFVDALEGLGLARALTESMLDQACAWKRRWQSGHDLQMCISINVSPVAITAPGFADRMVEIVERHEVSPSDVVFELTEGCVLADISRGMEELARLRLKGFGLSIDDFGVGYSSLSKLSQLPFTELKVDRQFVDGVVDRPRERAVVEASLELARKLRLISVAEGIETPEQWHRMALLGCELAQGYLISPPVEGDAVPAAIRTWRRPD